MTAITPEHGLRARLRRLAGGTAVLAIVLGACAAVAPSTAVAAGGSASDEEASVAFHVSAGLRGLVAPGSSTTAMLTVQNETESKLSSGQVQVELSRTPLTDEASVTNWLDEGEAPGDFDTIGSDTTAALDAGASGMTTVFVPAETLGALAPGVYPLRAELTGAKTVNTPEDRSATVEATATSVLVVADSQTAQVGVMVPLTATPDNGVLLSAEELSTLTGPEGALTAQLDGVAGTTAVLAIDPAILAAIRALGSAAPETARDWLDRLEALPNTRFALQFGDADATAQAQAGLPALLQPTTLATFLNPADFPQTPATSSPTADSTATPGPTPSPTGTPQLPDDAELTAIDGALPQILWPDDELREEDLDTFASYLGEGTSTIVSSAALGGQSAAHATVGGHDLLVTDSGLSQTLSQVAAEADSVDRQRLLAEAAALLTLAESRVAGAPLLIGLDRDENRNADALRDAISTADSIGFELSALRATPPASAALTSEADPARAAAVTTLLADEGTLTAFSSILADPQVLLSPERIRILRTLSVGSSAKAFAKKVEEHQKRTSETLAAVSIPPSSTIQLLTANADLPIAVRNDLPWPVTVQLFVSPTDPRLEVKPVTETVVEANSTKRVKVPVSARVGSGEVDLRLSLYSPTGVQIQDQQKIRVAVRAEWETIGLIVFGGLAALLIVLGVIRTVRRKRREAAEEAAVEAEIESLEEDAVNARPDGTPSNGTSSAHDTSSTPDTNE
ncbi:DUF6049 family protein [Microbacterium sp. JAI119]|uniref:DUF6049 family protein n=1 Tax=Microbacterium sp. JAI119 TaxID=2723062 RepID=UPI0017B90453|nr:DUF6049 family protein [Microbacterium sp. JAI119]NYF29793.1 hypothetical protein [Microbacterium sp. JAI119]